MSRKTTETTTGGRSPCDKGEVAMYSLIVWGGIMPENERLHHL